MLEVKFYDSNMIDDTLLKFAVIVSKSNGKWVLCMQKGRTTYECPGGHREPGELIVETAKRELYEETGALDYLITPVCVYSVLGNDGVIQNVEESFGMLYYAEIKSFGELPEMEMERIELMNDLPTAWTYPHIQPKLLDKVNHNVVLYGRESSIHMQEFTR